MNKLEDLYKKFENDSTLQKYDDIYQIFKENNDEYLLEIMSHYNNESSNRGIIRTILMALKPVISEKVDLQEMYKSLSSILKRKNMNKQSILYTINQVI